LNTDRKKIAMVYDKLDVFGGGERVLEQMLNLYPQSDVCVAIDIMKSEDRNFLRGKVPITTFAQNLPLVRNHHRQFLLLLMFAMEQLDLSDYELVLSGSASIAKGVITGPDQLHISYVHSPMRYAWDLQHQYLEEANLHRGIKGMIARWMLHRARMWDVRTANGVDHYIANSHFIARRIWKVYRREATVIYPPVDVDRFTLRTNKDSFYLTASRMVPYKKMSSIVAAFASMPERRLVVVGDGPEMRRIKALATPNVEILGYQPSPVLTDLMQRASAFVFAAEEDFGITPVEAQACGTPVIAFGRGGALETIRGLDHERPTGMFFHSQEPASICDAVREFEKHQASILPLACWENAQRFSAHRFREAYGNFVESCWKVFRSPASGIASPDRHRALQEAARGIPPVAA
jgi:glycosyltransferase involved in cell wall biosynthesis